MDVSDMQVMQMPTPGVMYLTSAASATSRGLELDVDWLLGRGWQLRGGLAWNHLRFDRFTDGAANYGGRRNPFAPDLTGHIGIRYQAPQGWYAQASLRGSGKVYLDAANQYKRNGYGLLDLVAGYRRGNWDIAAQVHNAANRRYDAVGYQNGFVTVYSPPREVSVRLTWRM
jgi:iron complex outermembrane receptor protein